MFKRATSTLTFLAALLFGACGPGRDTSRSGTDLGGKEPSKGTIGVSVLTLTNPFFKVIADTMTEEAARHGYRVLIVSGEENVARQQDQVKDFLVSKVAAIVLCPCDSTAIGPAIQEANARGVPVFTADIACLAKGAKIVAHIATDNLSGGKQAAQAMIEALGDGGGEVAILDYNVVESCQLRVQGFRQVIDAYRAGGGKITIVDQISGGGRKDQGLRAAQDLLQAHPNLAGIFAINDPSALGARAALENAGKADQVKLIGFDGQPEAKQAIKAGKIYADPIQYPDRIGRETVRAILRYFDGEQVDGQILIPTGLYRKADADKDASLR